MTITNIKRLEQDFEQGKTMKCPECKKVVSISKCGWVERILTTLKTIKETNKDLSINLMNTRMMKNGVIQKMHKLVRKLIEIKEE